MELTPAEEVELLVVRRSELGWDVIVNNKHRGLVFHNQVHRKLQLGDRLPGYIRQIRDDHKLDIVLEPQGKEKLEPAALKIYTLMGERGGMLHLHDKSDPAEIQQLLDMSKKTFKKAIGTLYRQKKIEIREDGIYSI